MNCVSKVMAAAATFAVVWTGSASAMSPVLKEIEDGYVRLGQEVRPSVVNIETRGTPGGADADQMDDLFHFFGIPGPEGKTPGIPGLPGQPGQPGRPQQPSPRQSATGSGFIYSKDGYIITNNHVVQDADEIIVRLQDAKEFPAKVIGADPDTDLAVIKIEPEGEDLKVSELGDSDQLKVGMFAIAMGSPRGFEGSLSFGHISALGREGLRGLAVQGLRFQNLIQTDAAINLGNSGGPLCNIDGQVVGINMAIVWGANSIGFAIPINTAKKIVPDLIKNGKVIRGYLGVAIDDAHRYADAVNLEGVEGAFVERVQPGTPAEKAKLQTYDVIRKVNGEPVKTAAQLVSKISSYPPGTKVTLDVWRESKPIDVEVTLEEWKPGKEAAATEIKDVLGMQLRPLTQEIVQRLGLGEDTKGVLVTGIVPASPAEDAHLQQGDIIIEAGQKPVSSPSELKDIVEKQGQPGKSLLVRYIRGAGEPDITVIRIPKK